EVLPGALADAVAGIDRGLAARLLGAQVSPPRLAAGAGGLRQGLALAIRALEAAEIRALAGSRAGDEEGHVGRLRRGLRRQAGPAQPERHQRGRRKHEQSCGLFSPPVVGGPGSVRRRSPCTASEASCHRLHNTQMTGSAVPADSGYTARRLQATERSPMIRDGIGGWVFPPWRGAFYPKGLPQARELEYASRKLTSIEINATFYRTQKPESFRKWAGATPDDFAFSIKGPQFATHRRVLAEAGESVERFFGSGVLELKSKLGPVLWQMPPTKRFDHDDFEKFLALLPQRLADRPLRHVVEVRHESFCDPAFVALLRRYSVAVAAIESGKHPPIAALTTDFVYARLQRTSETVPTGYPPAALDGWAQRARSWADGGAPADLPVISGEAPPKGKRDVFLYMISGAKVRAPAAAMALIQRLKRAA